MKTAVIKTGGQQYLVTEGSKIRVEKLPADPDQTITFDQVLLATTGKSVKIGQPQLANAVVSAKIIRHGRHSKVTGVKMKAKKRYRRYFGHRQPYTEVTITNIKG